MKKTISLTEQPEPSTAHPRPGALPALKDSAQSRGRHTHRRPRRERPKPLPGTALWVDKPVIREVMDSFTGQHLPVAEVLGTDYERLMQLRLQVRTQLHSEKPLYRCSLCAIGVYICCRREDHKFFFRHLKEDGSCPAVTRGQLSQEEINALKYNGAKESQLHLDMKEWLVSSLRADPRFHNVEKEATWRGRLTAERRRPDVRATYGEIPVAFEIQLSTTYLDVIAARREFYRREGGLLVWVFAEFSPSYSTMTDDDVFYNNNLNAFVLNERTMQASLQAQELMLECSWVQPLRQGGHSNVHRKMVSFHELTLDLANQRAFYFDFAAAKLRLTDDDAEAKQHLREDFEAWMGRAGFYGPDSSAQWGRFHNRFSVFNVPVPQYLGSLNRPLLTDLYSAKHNRPWGQKQTHLVEVAHRVANSEKPHLLWFMHAVRHYGRKESLEAEGRPGHWARRYRALRESFRQGDRSAFKPPKDAQALVEFLFPELVPLPDIKD